MSVNDYFWKAFEATGYPHLYLLYKKNNESAKDEEREKRQSCF